MKLPKNKTTLALVWRRNNQDDTEVAVAAFRTPEAADNYAGACQQDLLDRGFTEFTFGVGALTYYDE